MPDTDTPTEFAPGATTAAQDAAAKRKRLRKRQLAAGVIWLAAGVTLAMFFLPWVRYGRFKRYFPEHMAFQAGPPEVMATASGLQLAVGTFSLADPVLRQRAAVPPSMSPRPWFSLALAVPLSLAAAGLAVWVGKIGRRQAGGVLVITALVGAMVVLMTGTVSFSPEVRQYIDAMVAEELARQARTGFYDPKPAEPDWGAYVAGGVYAAGLPAGLIVLFAPQIWAMGAWLTASGPDEPEEDQEESDESASS